MDPNDLLEMLAVVSVDCERKVLEDTRMSSLRDRLFEEYLMLLLLLLLRLSLLSALSPNCDKMIR